MIVKKAPAIVNEGSSYALRVAQPLDMDDHITWDTGVAVVAGAYSVGRDADGTNQQHFNIPTGASYEWSINDVAKMVLDSNGSLIHNSAAIGGDVPSYNLRTASANAIRTAMHIEQVNTGTSAGVAYSVSLYDSASSRVSAGRIAFQKSSAWTNGTASTFDTKLLLQVLENNTMTTYITIDASVPAINMHKNLAFQQASTVSTTAGDLSIDVVSGSTVVFNDAQVDVDFRVESNGQANALRLDANAFGGHGAWGFFTTALSTSVVAIRRGAITAGADESNYLLNLSPGGAVTIPSGTAGDVATLVLSEPNITATGTVTTASTLRIANAPTEGTKNYALFVDGGAVRFDGSLWVESTPTEGASGEQLTSGGAGAIMTWAAASSLGKFKNTVGTLSSELALSKILSWTPKLFHYKSDAEMSTHDYDTVYTGVYAEEAPEVMHHDGQIFSPVSAFGYTVGAIKKLSSQLDMLRAQVNALGATPAV